MERLKEMANEPASSNVYSLLVNYLAFWATYFMLGMLIRNHSQVRNQWSPPQERECVCVCVCVCSVE